MPSNKQVSVYLHENIDPKSELCGAFADLKNGYGDSHWIGTVSGFGVRGLSWTEGLTLCAAIANALVKHGREGMFAGARVVFNDQTPAIQSK